MPYDGPATHSVTARPDLSLAQTTANNFQFNFNVNDYLLSRKPEYFVYLYNVSEQAYEVSRPPIALKIKIPGRKVGEKYALAGQFPQPIWIPESTPDKPDLSVVPQDAKRFAMDICNPENLGLDQDAVPDARFALSSGANLGKKGVFWSLNNPPTEQEINSAVNRMEKYYEYLLQEADAVAVASPQTLQLTLTPEHHTACDYFGMERTWHGKKTKPMDCPNCGTRVKEGIAFHVVDGDLCVIDWARTVKAGKRTRAQAFEATGDPQFAPAPVPQAAPASQPAPISQAGQQTQKPKNTIPTE